MFKTIRNIHFIGIGGSGMSGIAEVLLTLGYRVSGSDLKRSEATDHLSELGAQLHYGHKPENVGGAHVVVTSTAVSASNPEVAAARQRKIPVIPRIEMLAEIARLKYTVAVAGTHGKTTTTSMVSSVLQEGGLDPTFVIGGRVRHLGSGARLGKGEFLVAEADESDGSFLKLSPAVSIVTNVDSDHLDYYKSVKNLKEAFVRFANHVPFYGCVIACQDDAGARSILPGVRRRVVTYGFAAKADVRASDPVSGTAGTRFQVWRGETVLGEVSLPLPGRHNVLNALAAIVCGLELGVPFASAACALAKFESVGRRLEKRGEKGGAVWVDDYGHHPTEIRATLQALREKYPDKKIVVLFQPHRYSRTRLLLKQFARCFALADRLVLLPIYAAGEKPIPGVSSRTLLHLLKKSGVRAEIQNGKEVNLLKYVVPDTVLLTLGAGDVWKVGEKLFLGRAGSGFPRPSTSG